MKNQSVVGGLLAFSAFLLWGLLPVYWKAFGETAALEVLAHRIFWSLIFLILIVLIFNKWNEFILIFKDRRTILVLTGTSVLICINWLTFIWAINANHIVETSFGYFINPLMNVVLGVVLLKERLNRLQTIAVVLSVIGVLTSIIKFGEFPWIALLLSLSLASYGFLRKVVKVESLVGLTFETLLVAPIALGYILYNLTTEQGAFLQNHQLDLLFFGAGIITATPLVWFASAARKLNLSTLGFFQYLAPSCHLFIAIYVYNEPFTQTHFYTFGFIWLALIIYSYDSLVLRTYKQWKQ